MFRSSLYDPEYKPQFSGHETFPLRYGWLKKAYDAVADAEARSEEGSIFQDDSAIAKFGVGKNMVASMRHWALQCGIIRPDSESGKLRTTALGQALFSAEGLDPYMENPSTLWIIHWQLVSYPTKTTWFWVFNHFPNTTFDRDHLVSGLAKFAADRGWSRIAEATIKRDVDCFVRTYAARPVGVKAAHEDSLESPLTELGIIKAVGKRDGFRLVRGPKSSLGDGAFAYAVIDFWRRFSNAQTLSFEALAHHPGSPGQAFQLDENELAERLADLEEISGGALRWSETAGLKQLVRTVELDPSWALRLFELDYIKTIHKKVA